MSETIISHDPIGQESSFNSMGIPSFFITPEAIILNPDEAWAVKRCIDSEKETPYLELYELLDSSFSSGVYTKDPIIEIPTEQGHLLAGIYMDIYFEFTKRSETKAMVVRDKIEAILEYQPEPVVEHFNELFHGINGEDY